MKPPREQEADHTPDLTPMIDIVFLLIVFFMTVAHMKSEEMIAIEVPIADRAQIPEDRGVRMTVSMEADGQIYFGVRPVDLDQLGQLLRDEVARTPDIPVNLRVDARVPFRSVQEVLDVAASVGAANIIFANHQSDL